MQTRYIKLIWNVICVDLIYDFKYSGQIDVCLNVIRCSQSVVLQVLGRTGAIPLASIILPSIHRTDGTPSLSQRPVTTTTTTAYARGVCERHSTKARGTIGYGSKLF